MHFTLFQHDSKIIKNTQLLDCTKYQIMGNIMRHRVNMFLIAYLTMAMSARECLTYGENQETLSSELYPKESSSDAQQKGKTEKTNVTESAGIAEGHSAWPAVLGALTAVFSIGLLISLSVRYRFFRWCLTRNSHGLLLEGETASQAEELEGEILVRGIRGRMRHNGESSDEDDDDDDGFIEDNYIQAGVRKEEEEESQQEDAEDSDDELIIPEIR